MFAFLRVHRYNNVCLGLAALSIACITLGAAPAPREREAPHLTHWRGGGHAEWLHAVRWDSCAAVLYVLALNYKQMALFYAPVYFFYVLGRAWAFARGGGLARWRRASVFVPSRR